MKKFTSLLGISFIAWMLAPQSLKAQDCQFTPAVFPGQAADRTELDVNADVTVGEGGSATMRYGSIDNSLASSDESIVALFGGTSVYFVGAGSADVTYTETVRGRTGSCFTNHTIHYNVAPGTPEIYFAGRDGSPVEEYSVIVTSSASGGSVETGGGGVITGGGEDGNTGGGLSDYPTPGLVMNIKSFDSGRGAFGVQPIPAEEITYHSTEPSIATVSSSGITLNGGFGEVTLKAGWAGNANWKGDTATLHMVVKKQVFIYFNPATISDQHIGDEFDAPTPVISQQGLSIRWEHKKPAVATVDETTGHVTEL